MRPAALRLLLSVAVGSAVLVAAVPLGGTHAKPSLTSRAFLPLVMVQPTPARSAVYYDPGEFGYGMNLAHPDNSGHVGQLGFGWVKYQLQWKVSEPSKGSYDWADSTPWDSYAGNYVRDTAPGLKIVLRVDSPPGWANGNGGDQRPPNDPRDYGDFLQALATFLRGKVAAYEIWNEPNIAFEWGGRSPNPAEYVALLREAYRGVKAGDPNALVITGGLASTGGDGGITAMNDVDFINGMYYAGAKPYFDVLGSHPYGFASAPEVQPWDQDILFFRRAEAQRQAMVANGDGAKQIWATEFGWLIDPVYYGLGCDWRDRNWQKVSPDTQAAYLVRAYQYAYANWPWLGVLLTFNLDFADKRDWWRPVCEPMRWYATMDGNESPPEHFFLSPRPAYNALASMPKTPWR